MLPSQDHSDLLDTIDRLRGQGISRYIDLPQICVVGDQSSGKSSVLEAVSGIRFPTKDNLCTTHPTEVVCRRDSVKSASVSIVPSPDRVEEEKVRLLGFDHKDVDFEKFADLVDEAKLAMGIGKGSKAFSNDILRVEVSGPDQPNLTLVDLPGLFRAGNKLQSDKDAEIVTKLVRSYMERSRCIILAVISAKNDFANQVISAYARELDPKGSRTLGIITKPDMLHEGSDSEKAFVDLAENRDVFFRLGWHVLKNRDYDTRDSTDEERDEAEKEFFSKGVWASMDPSQLGIETLKPKLSTLLTDQIIKELPTLIKDIQSGIDSCESALAKLGASRGSLSEQRSHLIRIATEFSSLTKATVDATYVDGFFSSSMTPVGYKKRLRAVVQNILLDFSEQMRTKGSAKRIVQNPLCEGEKLLAGATTRADYVENVKKLIVRSRGCELPGTYNPAIIGDLFYEQAKPWKDIVQLHQAKILNAVHNTLELILKHTADKATATNIERHLLRPALKRLEGELQTKVDELLLPNQNGAHPITYNHYLTDNIQKAKESHQRETVGKKLRSYFGDSCMRAENTYAKNININALLDLLTKSDTVANMDSYAAGEAIVCMEAYYKVTLKTFVDDFSKLAVEMCLLRKLPSVLTPSSIASLDDKTVAKIAGESEKVQAERSRTEEKLHTLQESLNVLRDLAKHENEDEDEEMSDSEFDSDCNPEETFTPAEPAD